MTHVVRISDGLGNQMFQYAFAYALKRESGGEVLLDPLYWGTSLRKYQLEDFNISIKRKMVSEGFDYLLGAGPRNGRRFKDIFRNYLIKKDYKLVTEKQIMHFDEKMLHPSENSYYLGFWQTPAYFEKYKEDIKNELALKRCLGPKASLYLEQIKQNKSVAFHIRRTDYVRVKDNVAIDFTYYEKALSVLNENVGEYCLFVFTDDKEFVRNNFEICNYTMVEGVDDLEEFELMRRCDHHVIANSTYSWWASYLKENSEGLTIAPLVGIWTKEFYPEKWMLMEAEA